MQVITFDENGHAQKRKFTMPPIPKWTMVDAIGYEPKTTFWQDFSIADAFGLDAIRDTFDRAFSEWKNNVTYVTELSLVLNHKGCFYYSVFEHYNDKKNKTEQDERAERIFAYISSLYFELYEQVHEYCKENLTGEDGEYYFRITD